ncbi:MAG: 6,7-dimethyl-8-ribityllumazine synthase [Phycisphaerae bacterium]|nr:6,7-dimethyl-8-ribityllumazine synthase [Phycisphaerae bacterium]|tara:strand:+ start:508 stop:1014 length:507 start_codon:yes stop_codon:yes gene_type:complete
MVHVDTNLPPELEADVLRIAIVTSEYHEDITKPLKEAAEAAFLEAGGSPSRLVSLDAPGTFELTAVCRGLVVDRGHRTPDAVVALGCVIAGETRHDRYICNSVSRGLTDLTIQTGIPIAFGVLTCETREQALARAGGDKGNKGREAMHAAIRTAHVIRGLDAGGIPER